MKKILMYVSAFIPMFVIMLIREVALIIVDITNNKATWSDLKNPLLIGQAILILAILILFSYLMMNNKKRATRKIKVISVSNRSAEYYLGYYSVFLLSLISFSLLDIVDLITLVLLMIALGIVYIKNGLFFMNPTINIFQSLIYEIETDLGEKKLIISKHKVKAGDIVEVDISDFEFTFMRKKIVTKDDKCT